MRKEPRPWDGFAFGFVLSLMERLNVLFFHNASDSGMISYPKSGAKVGIKKKSLEFRDSFGTDGTISVLSVLNRY